MPGENRRPRGRAAFALAALFAAGGCAPVTPVGTAVSLVADGASYLVTGRSVTDSALSEIMDGDCKFIRVVSGEYICRAHPEPAAAPAPADPGSTAMASLFGGIEDPDGLLPAAPPPVAERPLPKATAENGAASFLVVGSYRTRAEAEAMAAGIDGANTVIRSVDVLGETAFRVVAGPLSTESFETLRAHLGSVVGGRGWRTVLCTETLRAPPCEMPPAPAAPPGGRLDAPAGLPI